MERSSFSNGEHENVKMPKTINEAIWKNPKLVNETFGDIQTSHSSVFLDGNERIKQEAFADIFGKLAGFDDSGESHDVAANAMALSNVIAGLYDREVDGIGAFDDFFRDGEPVSAEEVDRLIKPYLEENEAVNWVVDEYAEKVDPKGVNLEATKRLLAINFYLIDETEAMQQEELQMQQVRERFEEIMTIEGFGEPADLQAESGERDQVYFDREFFRMTSELDVTPTEAANKEFFELVSDLNIDIRTQDDFDNELRKIEEGMLAGDSGEVGGIDRPSVVRSMGELVVANVQLLASVAEAGVERNRRITRRLMSSLDTLYDTKRLYDEN